MHVTIDGNIKTLGSVVVFKNTSCLDVLLFMCSKSVAMQSRRLGPLATDAARQLDVLGHDGDALGMDGSQVGVLEEANEVSLSGLLQSQDCRGLEAQVCLEVLGNLAHQALEGQLADEQLGGLLVLADLTECNSSRPVAVRLLHTAGSWGALAGSLGGQLLAWSLAAGALASGLLGACHVCKLEGYM
jgi:hypothetical protein